MRLALVSAASNVKCRVIDCQPLGLSRVIISPYTLRKEARNKLIANIQRASIKCVSVTTFSNRSLVRSVMSSRNIAVCYFFIGRQENWFQDFLCLEMKT